MPGNEVMALMETDAKKVRNIRVQRDDTTNDGTSTARPGTTSSIPATRRCSPTRRSGDTEIWEIENKSGGWFHPVHIHLIDFKVLSRNGKAPFAWELGPKDVVYVGEGEKIRLLHEVRRRTRGKYMVHCHNLPHEDHDMMHQFSVGLNDGDVDVNDPIYADPASDDTDG